MVSQNLAPLVLMLHHFYNIAQSSCKVSSEGQSALLDSIKLRVIFASTLGVESYIEIWLSLLTRAPPPLSYVGIAVDVYEFNKVLYLRSRKQTQHEKLKTFRDTSI